MEHRTDCTIGWSEKLLKSVELFLNHSFGGRFGRIEMDNSELHSEHKHQSIQMLATVRAQSILFLFWWHICIGILYRCLVAIELHGDVILFAVCVCCFFFILLCILNVSVGNCHKKSSNHRNSIATTVSVSVAILCFIQSLQASAFRMSIACLPACLLTRLLEDLW